MTDWSRYEAAVAKRWAYYAPRFEKFARGKWLSWNWAAFIATLAWLRYRKLYAWSWVYLFLSTPFLMAVSLFASAARDTCEHAIDPSPASLVWLASLILLVVQWLLAPIVANRLYYNHVRAIAGKADSATGTGGYIGALALQILALIGVFVISSNYASYAYRAMVGEGVLLAEAATLALGDYLDEHRRLPAGIEAVTDKVSGRYVERLVLEPDGTVRAVFGIDARKLAGHAVSFIPERKNGRIVDWACSAGALPRQCLPSRCDRR